MKARGLDGRDDLELVELVILKWDYTVSPMTDPWDWYIYLLYMYHKNQLNIGKYTMHWILWISVYYIYIPSTLFAPCIFVSRIVT